jgi:hypothetical protein
MGKELGVGSLYSTATELRSTVGYSTGTRELKLKIKTRTEDLNGILKLERKPID